MKGSLSAATVQAAMLGFRPRWEPYMGSKTRTPGRHNKRRKSYFDGFNKEREMARRRRQLATADLRRVEKQNRAMFLPNLRMQFRMIGAGVAA